MEALTRALGDLVVWLRDKWCLAIIIFLATVISALTLLQIPLFIDDDGKSTDISISVRVVSAILIAGSALLDKWADYRADEVESSKQQDLELRHLRTLAALHSLSDRGGDLARETGGRRETRLKDLPSFAVGTLSAALNATNARVTHYTLSYEDGYRKLHMPVSEGRTEESTSIWDEKLQPRHAIWSELMDAPLKNSPIVRRGDGAYDHWIDWASKSKYDCFISVPIKTDHAQFGMISVNAPDLHSLTDVERHLMIAAAHMLAAVYALSLPNYRALRDSQEIVTERLGAHGRD